MDKTSIESALLGKDYDDWLDALLDMPVEEQAEALKASACSPSMPGKFPRRIKRDSASAAE